MSLISNQNAEAYRRRKKRLAAEHGYGKDIYLESKTAFSVDILSKYDHVNLDLAEIIQANKASHKENQAAEKPPSPRMKAPTKVTMASHLGLKINDRLLTLH